MFYHLNFVITFWLGTYYAILEPGLQIVNKALMCGNAAAKRGRRLFGVWRLGGPLMARTDPRWYVSNEKACSIGYAKVW